jgi:hypothetical protein
MPGFDGIGGISAASFDPEAFDPVRDGVRVMEAQRVASASPEMHAIGPLGVPQVGGFVQHTEITTHGIRTCIIHRWADEIGKHIAL